MWEVKQGSERVGMIQRSHVASFVYERNGWKLRRVTEPQEGPNMPALRSVHIFHLLNSNLRVGRLLVQSSGHMPTCLVADPLCLQVGCIPFQSRVQAVVSAGWNTHYGPISEFYLDAVHKSSHW